MRTQESCAAVADFTPEQVADQKIKWEKDDLVLRLKPTCDIAASLGKEKRPDQLLVGFALETCDEVSHAQDKLARKNFDFIVLNSLNDKGWFPLRHQQDYDYRPH